MHQSCSCTLKVMMQHASQNQRLGLNTEFTFSQKHSVLATMQPFASTGQTARSQLGWLYQPPLWLSKESINPCQQTVTCVWSVQTVASVPPPSSTASNNHTLC
jgi:hypothetical protein